MGDDFEEHSKRECFGATGEAVWKGIRWQGGRCKDARMGRLMCSHLRFNKSSAFVGASAAAADGGVAVVLCPCLTFVGAGADAQGSRRRRRRKSKLIIVDDEEEDLEEESEEERKAQEDMVEEQVMRGSRGRKAAAGKGKGGGSRVDKRTGKGPSEGQAGSGIEGADDGEEVAGRRGKGKGKKAAAAADGKGGAAAKGSRQEESVPNAGKDSKRRKVVAG